MKLALTLEADSVNVQALNMGALSLTSMVLISLNCLIKSRKMVIHSAWWMSVSLPKHRRPLPALTSCSKTMQ